MRTLLTGLLSIGFALGAVTCLSGCRASDRLVYDSFVQVRQYESTQGEVRAILGEPDEELGRQWLYRRPDENLTVFIDFDEHGRVFRKQWIDPGAGLWEDTNDEPTGD